VVACLDDLGQLLLRIKQIIQWPVVERNCISSAQLSSGFEISTSCGRGLVARSCATVSKNLEPHVFINAKKIGQHGLSSISL